MNQQKKEELRYSAGLVRESDIGIVPVRDTGGTDRRARSAFQFSFWYRAKSNLGRSIFQKGYVLK